ncbi:MAG: hypothetical protein PVI91_03030 [Gammaproteobacteria bacterium]
MKSNPMSIGAHNVADDADGHRRSQPSQNGVGRSIGPASGGEITIQTSGVG